MLNCTRCHLNHALSGERAQNCTFPCCYLLFNSYLSTGNLLIKVKGADLEHDCLFEKNFKFALDAMIEVEDTDNKVRIRVPLQRQRNGTTDQRKKINPPYSYYCPPLQFSCSLKHGITFSSVSQIYLYSFNIFILSHL